MKRHLFLVYIIALLITPLSAQVWKSVNPEMARELEQKPLKYHLASMDHSAVQGFTLPRSFPMPDGTMQTFEINEGTNFHPKLAAKYPEIKSYVIQSSDNALIRGRVSSGPKGLWAVIDHPNGEIYIDPVEISGEQYYISYYTKDYQVDPALRELYEAHEHSFESSEERFFSEKPKRSPFSRNRVEAVNLTTYRLALACTGEYAQRHGGTVIGALEAMNVALDRINFVLQMELSIRLELIPENDSIVFVDGSVDPYTNGNASQMALENNNYLLSRLGSPAYDVGHVFGTQCTDVIGTSGGIGTVCGGIKAFGSSCEISTTDRFYIGVVCHELGHQFGAEHTWNNCPTAPDNQFNSGTAFEPGSGTTIMSYAGSCGNQNIQNREDFYYHINSIEDITFFTEIGDGKECGVASVTINNRPSIEIQHTGGFYIPVSTPFRLLAEGSDPDGDPVTFNWEQYDAGIGNASMTPIDTPRGDAPIFRSVVPSESPIRYFPNLADILANKSSNTEVLPTYDRKLTFRATVRDNRMEGGGVAWDQLSFRVDGDSGPFLITDSLADTLFAGDYLDINWDVAGTDLAPVNCKNVSIVLSLDGGLTYTDTLLAMTPNDGSEPILIPNVLTENARIMIAAADNIFFDINDQNFVIQENTESGYAFDVLPHQQPTCLPSEVSIEINSFAIGGFGDSLDLQIVNKPEMVEVMGPDRILPGDQVTLKFDFNNIVESGDYEITLVAISPSGDSSIRSVLVTALSSDFSDLALGEPFSGETGLSIRPTFTWNPSVQADGYRLEVSPTPSFLENTVVLDNLSSPNAELNTALDESTIYYWRVLPYNACGTGDYTEISAFQTINLACEEFVATDLPKNISQSVIVPVESKIEVAGSGIVSDVNVSTIGGFHEAFGDLIFTLISPAGTAVTLVRRQCGFSSRQFSIGFDDDANAAFDCQTNLNGQIFNPEESLDAFENESITGIWTLRVVDSVIGSGGAINDWKLELCGSLTPQPPMLTVLDTVDAIFGSSVVIDQGYLETTDEMTDPQGLIYTLTTVPAGGTLLLDSRQLNIGEQFSQLDINSNLLTYEHLGIDSLDDDFSFTVMDDEGGWIAPTSLPITIDTETVPTRNHQTQLSAKVFPNPATGSVFIQFDEPSGERSDLYIYDLQGRIVLHTILTSEVLHDIEINQLTHGIYILQVIGGERSGFTKLIIN